MLNQAYPGLVTPDTLSSPRGTGLSPRLGMQRSLKKELRVSPSHEIWGREQLQR
jgi:hypothetical protein